MKKFLILMLSAMLIVFCAGCGTFTPPIVTEGNNSSGGSQEKPGDNTGEDDPGLTGNEFTVSLKNEDGSNFYVLESDNIKAVWKGQGETHSVKFSGNGVAVARGLDGSYEVSLIDLPEGYTYDPNADYLVNNYKKSVTVVLMRILSAEGEGTAFFKGGKNLAKQINGIGTYRAVISEPGQKIYYQFSPSPGKYSIQSWVSVQENEVDPVFTHYISSSSAYVDQSNHTDYPDGGKCGTFTKNFKFELDRADSEDGTWGFRISANVKAEHPYPVYIDFTITRGGDSDRNTKTVEAKGPFADMAANAQQIATETQGNNWHYIYEGERNNLLDGAKVALNESDGFYHVLKPDGNGGWEMGPLLYVTLTRKCSLVFTGNYGFAEGIESESADKPFSFLCGDLFKDGYRNYDKFLKEYIKHTSFTAAKPGSTNAYKYRGYHPVNQEIKDFLEDYALHRTNKEPLFDDGSGEAEKSSYKLTSGPDGVWLFTCGYFGDLIVKNAP